MIDPVILNRHSPSVRWIAFASGKSVDFVQFSSTCDVFKRLLLSTAWVLICMAIAFAVGYSQASVLPVFLPEIIGDAISPQTTLKDTFPVWVLIAFGTSTMLVFFAAAAAAAFVCLTIVIALVYGLWLSIKWVTLVANAHMEKKYGPDNKWARTRLWLSAVAGAVCRPVRIADDGVQK